MFIFLSRPLACSMLIAVVMLTQSQTEGSCLQPPSKMMSRRSSVLQNPGDQLLLQSSNNRKGGARAGRLTGDNRKYLTIRENGAESP